MNRRQEQILIETAEAHGISITEAREIWKLFTDKIATSIEDPSKRVEGLYELEKFPVIKIDKFGRFIPNANNIKYANHCLKSKKVK
jgi:hypothetical protein